MTKNTQIPSQQQGQSHPLVPQDYLPPRNDTDNNARMVMPGTHRSGAGSPSPLSQETEEKKRAFLLSVLDDALAVIEDSEEFEVFSQ